MRERERMGGRWRRKKKQELLVVGSEYRERRRSYWLWAKKIKSEEEIIRKRKDAETAELWRKVRETDVKLINYEFPILFIYLFITLI